MEFAIETRGVTKDFDRERVLDNLDLTVPAGSVFGLVGPNGVGKSTLIKILMGIYKPNSGTVSILGRDNDDPSGQIRQQIGYVADFQYMYPLFRVEEILEFCSKVYENWDWQRCKSLLSNLALPPRKRVFTLSKGMKTQLALVIALSIRPRLMILDEPTSGLDPVIKRHLMQLIMQEAASGDTTVFFSTHNVSDLERMADRVALLMRGKIIFNKAIQEFKSDSRKIQAVFPDGLPENIRELPEVLHIEVEGKVYSITVGGSYEEILARIKSFSPLYIETVDVGLEELLIQRLGKEGYGHEFIVLE